VPVILSPVGGAGAQFFDNNGDPLSGGKLYSYAAGTTTPQTTYTSSSGATPHANPIILDAAGRIAGGGEVWLTDGVAYKFVLMTSTNVLIATWDDITGINASSTAADISFTGFKGQTGTVQSLASNTGSDWIGFTQAGTGAIPISAQEKMRQIVSVNDFGAVGDGVTNDTGAIQDAIQAIRSNPVQILDTIGGNLITVYTSGTIYFPKGVYLISSDLLRISQDIGLKLVGAGSRRTNNAEYGPTTLLVSDSSSGFAIQAYRNGGRGLTIEDMDICYSGSFTGSLVDAYDAPGLTMNRCYVGTYGITSATRQTTAAACVRSTYDEFMTFNNCVFNGAQLGWWIDNARTFNANTFGGSITSFNECVFYDFAVNMVYSNGTRTRETVNFYGCSFNPISVSPSSSAINVDNVNGFNLIACNFAPSTTEYPASQWLRATNTTGMINGNTFGDLATAAYLGGVLSVNGNTFSGVAGLTLTSGVITGSSNEFQTGTGWLLSSPTDTLSVDIGPDLFKSGVTYSYDIPTDNALFSGRINYAKDADASANKFRNTSEGVAFVGTSDRLITTSSTPVTLSVLETGNTYLATGGSAQAFTLPTPVPGTRLCVSKVSSVNLSITCAATTNFYGVGSTYPTVATLTGAAMGTIELEAYSTVGWVVKTLVGSWSFT